MRIDEYKSLKAKQDTYKVRVKKEQKDEKNTNRTLWGIKCDEYNDRLFVSIKEWRRSYNNYDL